MTWISNLWNICKQQSHDWGDLNNRTVTIQRFNSMCIITSQCPQYYLKSMNSSTLCIRTRNPAFSMIRPNYRIYRIEGISRAGKKEMFMAHHWWISYMLNMAKLTPENNNRLWNDKFYGEPIIWICNTVDTGWTVWILVGHSWHWDCKERYMELYLPVAPSG